MARTRLLLALALLLNVGCASAGNPAAFISLNSETTQLRGWVLLVDGDWYLFGQNLYGRRLVGADNKNCVTLINGSGRPTSDLLVFFQREVWVRGHVVAWEDLAGGGSDNGVEIRTYEGRPVDNFCNREELFVFTEIGVG